MPGMDGLAVAGAVRERRLPTAIVCLTMHKDARFLNAALNAGVMGYVIKDDALLEIVESVKSVAAGRHFVSPQLTSHLVARHAHAGAAAEQTPGIEALTDTERKSAAPARRVQDDQGNRGGAGHQPADGRSAPLEHGRKARLQRQPRPDQVRGDPQLRSLKTNFVPSPFCLDMGSTTQR